MITNTMILRPGTDEMKYRLGGVVITGASLDLPLRFYTLTLSRFVYSGSDKSALIDSLSVTTVV